MNCRSAQRLLSAERDGALAPTERAALDAHLEACADCRRFRAAVAGAAEAWRTSVASVPVPDIERAWQAIRRELRSGGVPAGGEARPTPWFSRWVLPIGAAAAVAVVAIVVAPRWGQAPVPEATAPREMARAEFVEVPGNASSSMVYVDDKSGWLVVWAVDDKRPASG